jgi:thiamine-phosphate pyrophosphorylase
LATPVVDDVDGFAGSLSAALSAGDIAAVLLRLAPSDERTLINCVKQLAPIVQERGAALILDGHVDIVARAGADGAHVTGLTEFTEAVATLKPERIVGSGGLLTKHDAMLAAERGADYVMFGEPDDKGRRPAFETIEKRVSWWAEVFETPCVGFAATLAEVAPLVKAGADFIALGDFLWREPQAVRDTLTSAASMLRLPETAA